MYYKVLKDNKVIDVLDRLIYLKWQPKHSTMVLCDENEAQAILSSDMSNVWHEETLYNIPVHAECYETVRIEEIDKYEYEQRKVLNGKSPNDIIDEFLSLLIREGVV
jgi:hypothetical protein